MDRFRGVSAARQSLSKIIKNPIVLLHVALTWALIHTTFLLGYCLYIWATDPFPLDIAGNLMSLRQITNFRTSYFLTAIPDTLSLISVNILWTRFVLTNARPSRWIEMPDGSARYFKKGILLGLGFIAGLIPPALLASMPSTFIPAPFAAIISFTILGIGVLAMLYFATRVSLIFPAIAVHDSETDFAGSYELTKRIWPGMLTGGASAYLALFAGIIATDVPLDLLARALPTYGVVADAFWLLREILSELILLAGSAAIAGVSALAYSWATDVSKNASAPN
jgi:hypothetical protein